VSQSVEVRSNRESVAKILASRLSEGCTSGESCDKCRSMIEGSVKEAQRLFGYALMQALGFALDRSASPAVLRNARGDTASVDLIERVLEQ